MQNKCLKGTLMLIDFRKAFDTVEFQFIEDISCWIKLMYEKVESSILGNGWKTSNNVEIFFVLNDILFPSS